MGTLVQGLSTKTTLRGVGGSWVVRCLPYTVKDGVIIGTVITIGYYTPHWQEKWNFYCSPPSPLSKRGFSVSIIPSPQFYIRRGRITVLHRSPAVWRDGEGWELFRFRSLLLPVSAVVKRPIVCDSGLTRSECRKNPKSGVRTSPTTGQVPQIHNLPPLWFLHVLDY